MTFLLSKEYCWINLCSRFLTFGMNSWTKTELCCRLRIERVMSIKYMYMQVPFFFEGGGLGMVQFNTQCVLLLTTPVLKICNFVYSEQIAHQDNYSLLCTLYLWYAKV